VQVTLTADGADIEEFWQLARANGATPRNAAEFTKKEADWHRAGDGWLQIIP
jgi:hypothetical protein